jgi:threonine dehydrogenase-like Zn-dependent dehydrogenase
MKHTYPRAIHLAAQNMVDLHGVVSHYVPLEKTPEAYEMNTEYRDNVVKVIVTGNSGEGR